MFLQPAQRLKKIYILKSAQLVIPFILGSRKCLIPPGAWISSAVNMVREKRLMSSQFAKRKFKEALETGKRRFTAPRVFIGNGVIINRGK